MAPQLDRLKSQLLTSGIQQENIALFQVINQLIDHLRDEMAFTEELKKASSTPGGGSSPITDASYLTKNVEFGLPNSKQVIPGAGIEFNDAGGRRVVSTAIPFGIDSGVDGEDGFPGPPGKDGARGLQGILGVPGIDGMDGDVGEQGIQGIQGPIGPMGFPGMLGLDGEDGEPGLLNLQGEGSLVWKTRPFNAANYNGSSSMVWTVEAGDIITEAWRWLDAKTIIFAWRFENTVVSGVADGYTLEITLPTGMVASRAASVIYPTFTGIVWIPGMLNIHAGGSIIYLYQCPPYLWPLSTTTRVEGQIILELR